MNHKRGKPKQARAGCLLCKPHKFGHGKEHDFYWSSRGNIVKKDRLSRYDLKESFL